MGNDLIKITDFTQYNNLFIQFFKDKTNFIKIQNVLAEQCKEIENAIFEMLDAFNIDNAIGNQLDIIGLWVDLARNGRNDEDYRSTLKVKITVNSGSGEHETIIKAITNIYRELNKQLLIDPGTGEDNLLIDPGSGEIELEIGLIGSNVVAQLVYLGNANLQIWTNITLTSQDYLELLKIIAAGVGLILIVGSDNPFVFLDDPDGSGFSKLRDELLLIDPGTGENNLVIDSGSGAFQKLELLLNSSDPDDGGELQGLIL